MQTDLAFDSECLQDFRRAHWKQMVFCEGDGSDIFTRRIQIKQTHIERFTFEVGGLLHRRDRNLYAGKILAQPSQAR